MKRLVADTGPVLHLQEAGALPLLSLSGEVFLAPLVLPELQRHAPTLWPNGRPAWAVALILSPRARQRAEEWKSAGLLHGGEAEALALAIDIEPDWFLTDDAAARLMAESLGIHTRGSLGVVLGVAAQQLVSKAEAKVHLAALANSSLWMSRRVQTEAHAALDKMFPGD